MKVLICDDDPIRGTEVNEHIRVADQAPGELLTGDQLTTALNNLFASIKALKQSRNSGPLQWDFSAYKPIESPFDDVDVLLVDNNLTLLDTQGPPLTAESIAGYLRAFTAARYIVSLNMNPDVDFDLRYLVGDFQTRADLAINARHLENRSLWTGDPEDSTDGFCPWYWPRLHDIASYRTRQIEFVEKHYKDSVLGSLSFDDEAVQMLSRHAQGALAPDASHTIESMHQDKALRDITFREFFLSKSRALPVEEERSQLAAACSGNESVRRIVARIVAADIDLWLRRDVVGPQEPLVDVPHLTGRFPFLMGDRANQVEHWNTAIRTSEPPFGWNHEMHDLVSPTRFEHEHTWLQKACFWWSKLNEDERLNDRLLSSTNQRWADAVFCEDTSRYEPRTGDTPPAEFVAEFEGVWNRRYIKRLEGVNYAPLTRLAL